MKILITGYTGFVGSNLCKALSDAELSGIDIVESPLVLHKYNWNNFTDAPPVDCIIHLAGKAHDTSNTTAEKAYFDINEGLTRQIFEYFLQSEATKIIYFSSVKAVADTVIGELLTEEEVPRPGTAYGQSKLEAERYIIARLEQWTNGKGRPDPDSIGGDGRTETGERTPIQSGENGAERCPVAERSRSPECRTKTGERRAAETLGKRVYILRPCMIHGPGNKGNLNLLYKVVKKGIPWPLGAFENKRTFCSIDNLIYVVRQLIVRDIEPGIYQVADDLSLSTNALIRIMADSLHQKAKIWSVPVGLIKALARAGDYLHLPLNSERLKKLTESYVVSNQKLKNALGISGMPVSAEDGLRKTFQSFRS